MNAIVPTNDLEEHEDYSTTCKCEPKVIYEDGEMIIVHNAFDQREIIEEIEQILNKENSK